ncbi:MAG TPA: 3'-5' exonuclease [Candidatus Cybelea sp.]|jgi:DNA polymerase III epsilon subunit family exonuclease|nr:3'-5' exonuclease [Candidatus Cybelea sp.]
MLHERYCVIDVETTGFSPVYDRVVEIACALVDGDRIVERWATLVNPCIPIPPSATAIHGITDEMVADAPVIESALRHARRLSGERVVAAHCARFDLSFVGGSMTGTALCTMLLARAIFPEAPNHKNQTLRRYLRIDRVAGEELAAHRALGDALVTAHVLIACRRRFRICRQGDSWERFIRRHALVKRPAGRADLHTQ